MAWFLQKVRTKLAGRLLSFLRSLQANANQIQHKCGNSKDKSVLATIYIK